MKWEELFRKELRVKIWILVLIPLCFSLLLGIQSCRVYRRNKLIYACKEGIKEAKADKAADTWRACQKIVSTCDRQKEESVKKITKKIEDLAIEKKKIEKKINRMKPSDLQNGFKEEGF